MAVLMKVRGLGWLALPLGVCALMFGWPPADAQPGSSQPVGPYWVVGDSIGVGVAAALRRSGVRVVEKARNGTTARQWREWLRDVSRWPESPSVVVVSLGTNDAVSAELLREFRANARQIMGELRARGHRVIWILPPSPESRIPQGSDLEFFLSLGGDWMFERTLDLADKWHPTAAGYDRLADLVRKWTERK